MKSVISVTIKRENQYFFNQKSQGGQDGAEQHVRRTLCLGDSNMTRLSLTFRYKRGEMEL